MRDKTETELLAEMIIDVVKKSILNIRIDALLKEYPFLKRYPEIKKLHKVPQVQKADSDLMSRYPWTSAWNRRLRRPDRIENLRFILIAADGQEIGMIKQYDLEKVRFSLWRSNTWFNRNISTTGKTVEEAIQELSDPNEAAYVLEIKDLLLRKYTDPNFGIEIVIHKVTHSK